MSAASGCNQGGKNNEKHISPSGTAHTITYPTDEPRLKNGALKAAGNTAPPAPAMEPAVPLNISVAVEHPEALSLGKTGRLSVQVKTERDVARLLVQFAQTEALAYETTPEIDLGPSLSGEAHSASIQARFVKPGKFEVRVWARAYDNNQHELFSLSRVLYMVVNEKRVWAGDVGFMELELAELKRQLDAGELKEPEYSRQKQRIKSGRAAETITITAPNTSAQP